MDVDGLYIDYTWIHSLIQLILIISCLSRYTASILLRATCQRSHISFGERWEPKTGEVFERQFFQDFMISICDSQCNAM